ncbi:MAG: transglutaminase family protein [Bryobacteraceae bacterium]|nr:transglutaminase family protein [Bryobacteraceae bacterium]
MSFLCVQHATTYRYAAPVELGEHRMLFRPRESHDLRLIRTSLLIRPQPSLLRWVHDPFDNSVAVATFQGSTTELHFNSTVTIEHFENSMPEYPLEEYARTYPFSYSDEDFSSLGRALNHHGVDESVSQWALQFLDAADRTGTVKMLSSMSEGIREQCTYVRRPEKGVQTAAQTLRSRRGSCRDFAVLMMEATRSLGVAARFVSGYIFVPNASGVAGGGATHAWMQAYLPGAGWIDFDPTNSIIGNRNLIRVAVAWAPEHALPLWGTYAGAAEDFLGMDVTVSVTEVDG